MDRTYIEWSESAFEDVQVSIELYELKRYPQSIFYLQQSIEKTSKYIGLKEGFLSFENCHKDIGHKTTKVFKKQLQKLLGNSNMFQGFIKDLQKIEQTCKEEPLKVIPYIIKSINQFENTDEYLPLPNNPYIDQIKDFFKSVGIDDHDELNQLEKLLSQPDTAMFYKKKFENQLDKAIETSKSLQILFVLSAYFQDYTAAVRYPNESGILPSEVLTSKHLLIQELPFFQEHCKNAIKRLVNFFELS